MPLYIASVCNDHSETRKETERTITISKGKTTTYPLLHVVVQKRSERDDVAVLAVLARCGRQKVLLEH